jgi:hypothetical protein
MTTANLHILDDDGRWVPVRGNATGYVASVGSGGGGGGLPAGQPTILAPWSYAAAANGITNTSDVTLKAAPGAGKSIYVTSIQVQNTSATGTEFVLKSGSTVLWRCAVSAATGPIFASFDRPVIVPNNTALTAACLTTATVTYVNAQGYADETLESLNAELTVGDEIFDEAGTLVTDEAGATIYL